MEKVISQPDTRFIRLKKAVVRDRALLIIIAPVIIYFLIFYYWPMYGNIIAFKNFSPGKGILGSPWVGFKYFEQFFNSIFFWRLLRNTVLISFYGLIAGFPIPILFALMINELKDGIYKKSVQTISYMPYFISLVVTSGIILNFLSPSTGVVNLLLSKAGIEPIHFMLEPGWFRFIYVVSGIWQNFGWNSIIYLAALAGIDQELYKAAKMDGANRFKQIIHISIPCILPTVIILLILSIGSLMSVGFEKIILLYNPNTLEVADVISTYTYRRGIVEADYSFGTAVGLFNSLINLVLLFFANNLSKKFSETSLW